MLTTTTSKQIQNARQKGIALVEAMIAILLFSIGILAITGLQATLITDTSEAQYRAQAGYIAQQRIGTIWADPDNLVSYAETNTVISGVLPAGTRTTAISGVEVTVTVKWQKPSDTNPHQFSATATVTGG